MTTKEISSSDINTIVSSKVIKRKKNMNKRIWHYNYQLALVDPFDHQKKVVGFFAVVNPYSPKILIVILLTVGYSKNPHIGT